MTHQITIGSDTYDVYVTVAMADTYLKADPQYGPTWETLTEDDKGINIVSATRSLDRNNWEGERTDPAQPLDWPRTGVTDSEGNPVDSAAVPTEIEDACSLIAGMIAQDAKQANDASTGSNTRRVKAGTAEVEFFRPERGSPYSRSVMQMIGQFLSGAASLTGGFLSTGTGCPSETPVTESTGTNYGRNSGFA